MRGDKEICDPYGAYFLQDSFRVPRLLLNKLGIDKPGIEHRFFAHVAENAFLLFLLARLGGFDLLFDFFHFVTSGN